MPDFVARTPRQMGAILRGYRRQRHLTQAAVGSHCGLSQPALSQIESDPATAGLERVYRVLAALELELVVRPRKPARGPGGRKPEW